MDGPSLRRGLAWTGFGSVVNLGFLFAETALVAHLLPTEQYGGYVFVLTTVYVLQTLVDFGINGACTQFLASGHSGSPAPVVSTAVGFRVAILGGTALLILSAGPLVGRIELA